MTFSILVNSTDSYEDSWYPFFKLFSIYWPDYHGAIYLNTEIKKFQFKDLNIISIQNTSNDNRRSKTWSECLSYALDNIKEEIILYVQEDYFLRGRVKSELVQYYATLIANNDIDCIHLTDQHSIGPFETSNFNDLWIIDRNAPYRLSCQAALWKKNVLRQYLRAHETPWEFELYGTKRASSASNKFYTINRNIYKLNTNEILPYIFTGIIQARWNPSVIQLFQTHNIVVNFEKRGFIDSKIKMPLARRARKYLRSMRAGFSYNIELCKAKIIKG